ncbi:DEAD/DEAH box helicase [Verrucomicrobiota bacterium sgz303538]
MPFSALGLGTNLLKAIQEAGYIEPTPIQAAAIPEILAGHDLIGIAQTGTGKTAAFTLPMLAKLSEMLGGGQKRGTKALVLAPTRELVVQIHENVRAYGKHLPLRIATVYGGVGERPQIEALKSGAELVIATPGRLLDLMDQGHANFRELAFLVLDEADRMLDMGFLPSMKRIVKALPKNRQTLLFSATLSKEIEQLTKDFQHSPKIVQIGRRSNPADTVTQIVYEVPKHLKVALLEHLLSDPSFDSVLVFSRTKHGADKIARKLERSGIKTATLHSNRSQNQRILALNKFKAGEVRVLVATDIAARGIDVEGISHVVNYDFPMHPEDYVHRIGRTGRAQAIGDAISFISKEDYNSLRSLERFIGRGLIRKQAENFDYNAPAADAERHALQDRVATAHMRPGAPSRSVRQDGRPAGRSSRGKFQGARPGQPRPDQQRSEQKGSGQQRPGQQPRQQRSGEQRSAHQPSKQGRPGQQRPSQQRSRTR